MDILQASNYPLPSQSALQLQYVGKHLNDLPTPIPVIDRAVAKRNCNAMLDVCKALGVGFRAHVKSHKTVELAKLQVGHDGPADFIVSTLNEAESLLPFLIESQAAGRQCSVLYGVPIPQSAVPRLLRLAKKLKPGTISVLIDNIDALLQLQEQANAVEDAPTIGVFIKIDTGYHRAGIEVGSNQLPRLVQSAIGSSRQVFKGFYTHYGHSYAGSSEDDAAAGLLAELHGLQAATNHVPQSFKGRVELSVGATPTATAAQNMLQSSGPKVAKFKGLLEGLLEKYKVELHAGVYPLLDLQQVATHARPPDGPSKLGFEPLSKSNIGLKVLVEVSSVYTERAKPEALISAGSLALGREPCKSYPGWGIVASDLGNSKHTVYDESGDKTGWIVGRISQEHGILAWEGKKQGDYQLAVGTKVLIWPNHACVAGAGFGWYLIVDSEQDPCRVVDVWVRGRGW
ncbi:hypothetical protein EJ04DRAFT_514823 [Polyplosphaeria fusca]|uniref:D-serine dehydratase n=1 Tax=Polyplosphaeria fusca TaxID=682080 RepID=A0A9P4QU15_9PLEO|nr:hypothetical protein EJ04DRAFT_514823 [Polyplosphaeria fusca]